MRTVWSQGEDCIREGRMRETGRGKQAGWLLGSRCAVKSSQVGALSAQLTPLNLYLHFCTGRSAVDATVLGQILSKSPLSCSAQSVKAKVQVCQVGLANRDPMQMLPEIKFSTQQDHQCGFEAVNLFLERYGGDQIWIQMSWKGDHITRLRGLSPKKQEQQGGALWPAPLFLWLVQLQIKCN